MNLRRGDIINQYFNEKSSLQDAVKTLRANIQFSSIDNELKTIVVTSVMPQEGKSTLSIFLGIAMAEYGKKTLLVECDNRRPMIGNYLRRRAKTTVADIISGRNATPLEAVEPTGMNRLDFLDSIVMANPVEVLSSRRFWAVIEELKSAYDIIIMDTPPLGSFIEAAVLAAKADGTLLVLKAGRTDANEAKKVIAQLEKAKARLLGAVLNDVDMSSESYYSDYYYSGGQRKKRRDGHKQPPRGARVPSGDDVPQSAPAKPRSAQPVPMRRIEHAVPKGRRPPDRKRETEDATEA